MDSIYIYLTAGGAALLAAVLIGRANHHSDQTLPVKNWKPRERMQPGDED